MKHDILKEIGKGCPRCKKKLHVGTKKEGHELEEFEYCKSCGYRNEFYENV